MQTEAAPIFYSNNTFFTTVRDADISEIVHWLEDTSAVLLKEVKHLILNIEPTSVADLLQMARASNRSFARHQALQLVEAMTKAGLKVGSVKVNIPELKHISKNASLLRFDYEYAENIRMQWLSALEEEMKNIEEEGLVDSFRG